MACVQNCVNGMEGKLIYVAGEPTVSELSSEHNGNHSMEPPQVTCVEQ